jgi:agmatine deiminase
MDKFILGAEWEIHEAVWLAWPYDKTTFHNRVEKLEKVYCQIIKALKGSERVHLLVLPEMKIHAEEILNKNEVDLRQITFHLIDYADVWIRDYGPIFLVNRKEKKLGWVKAQYNAYGKKEDSYYEPLLKDNEVFETLTPEGKKFNLDIVLEGGSIESNGEGILLTTEQCLLNSNRNPHLNKNKIEEYLKNYLGVKKIIWLKQGLVNDHTDGHVDDLVKFVSPNKILCCYEDDPKDENYEILKNNFEILAREPLEMIKLPMPHMYYDNGTKAPASYANLYISNTVVLVPIYYDQNDEKALEIIQSCFPNRKVIGIGCRDLIYGGGAIHCITQQQPAI